ncbi:MAG: aminoacyl-tRNA hydrolase [Candidatus Kryptoniota bacterium]
MIVGLGNVGKEFEATRHNVGFMVVDSLARKFKKHFLPGKGDYYFARFSIAGDEVYLLKPTTYMNNSGNAVKDAIERFEINLADMLVTYDDFALPLGKIRIRKMGSDGGHNGVASIIYSLGSNRFPRLRCGIGNEQVKPGSDMASFVLSTFSPEEIPVVEKMVNTATDAVLTFLTEGTEAAMNQYN